MKIGSIAVVVVLVAFLALGQEVLAQNDEMSQAEMSAYFERQLRDFVFSVQQIWSNAGEGAQYVTNALDQLETSLNRPVFSEIWGNITSELEGTPFSYLPFPLDLDPSILIEFGSRARQFVRNGIQTTLSAIEANPNFPEQSITNDPAFANWLQSTWRTISNYIMAYGFTAADNGGPIFPTYIVLEFFEAYDFSENVQDFDVQPLKRAWSWVQKFLNTVQLIYTHGVAIYQQDLLVDFPANVNAEARPYFQLALTQLRETWQFYLALINQKPGNLQREFRLLFGNIPVISEIVPKLFERPELWKNLRDNINDAVNAFAEANFDQTASFEEVYEEFYTGSLQVIVNFFKE